MAETDAVRRGEAFLALLRRLRERPLLPVPGSPESEAELYARVDRPGHAALLSEDQYTLILRSSRVAWRSILAFITQEPDGSSTRTFWIDPHRLTRFGCLLSEEDIDVAGPLFGLDRASTRPCFAEIDLIKIVCRLDSLEVGSRFVLPDGQAGEVTERFALDMAMVSVCLDPDSVLPFARLLAPGTPVYPIEEPEPRRSERTAAKRAKLRLVPHVD